MLFAYPADVLRAVTPTSDTAVDSDYPLSNLHDGLPTEVTRWTVDTATRLVWDFTTPQTLEGLLLVMHTFDPGASLTLQANATAAWGAPSFSQAVVVPAHADHLPKNITVDLRGTTLDSVGYRYVSLLIPANTGTDHAIGELLLIAEWQTTSRPPVWPVRRSDVRRVTRNVTAFGVEHVVDRGVRQRKVALTFPTLTNTDRDALLQLARDCGGEVGFPLCYHTAVATDECHYMRFAPASIDEFVESLEFIDQNAITLELLEIQRGVAL
jgi:hypothetical protein